MKGLTRRFGREPDHIYLGGPLHAPVYAYDQGTMWRYFYVDGCQLRLSKVKAELDYLPEICKRHGWKHKPDRGWAESNHTYREQLTPNIGGEKRGGGVKDGRAVSTVSTGG